jgi:hypothetical protein
MEDRSKVQLWLSKAERQQLGKLLRGSLQPVRTVLRALVLRQLADGQAIRKVARNVGLTPQTVWLTSQRYQQAGWSGPCMRGRGRGKNGGWMPSSGSASWL